MKKIVAAVALDGRMVERSDYFNDYPLPRLLDFREQELVISNFYKMKTADYRDPVATIPYGNIKEVSLKIVRRVKGQRITLLNTCYDFDLDIITDTLDEWNIETEAVYEVIEGLKRIGTFNDVAGVSDRFRSRDAFQDSCGTDSFRKFCGDHYEEWIREYGFENGRLTFPDRNI